jgi:hypothetical protein
MSFAGKWMELEIMMSEISQIQATIGCFLLYVESRRIKKSMKVEGRLLLWNEQGIR